MNNNTKISYDKKVSAIIFDEQYIKNTGSQSNNYDYSSQDNSSDFVIDSSVSVFDVAAYILQKLGTMTAMKLQKLVYYCQAWTLVWDEKPLFKEAIEAWANGPVVRELFVFHKGMFQISALTIGNPDLLNDEQKETIDAVLDYYGDKSAQWLV